MGNHSSHDKPGTDGSGSGASTPRGSTRGGRSGSSGELQGQTEKPEAPAPLSLVPVEKLGKVRLPSNLHHNMDCKIHILLVF